MTERSTGIHGTQLPSETEILKVEEGLAPSSSVAVTRITYVAILVGVPLKVPVAGSKLNQPGSGEPPDTVALSGRGSLISGSAKESARSVKVKGVLVGVVWFGIVVTSKGALSYLNR